MKKHLLPVLVEDSMHGKEVGIRIAVHGLDEDETSVLYVRPAEAVLYESRYGSPRKFKRFDAFVDWYKEELVHRGD